MSSMSSSPRSSEFCNTVFLYWIFHLHLPRSTFRSGSKVCNTWLEQYLQGIKHFCQQQKIVPVSKNSKMCLNNMSRLVFSGNCKLCKQAATQVRGYSRQKSKGSSSLFIFRPMHSIFALYWVPLDRLKPNMQPIIFSPHGAHLMTLSDTWSPSGSNLSGFQLCWLHRSRGGLVVDDDIAHEAVKDLSWRWL